ncbi:hypothetical protein WJX81_001285 [Elliptochloris bilobata]|uniref:Calcium-transporting ATPase n=1 Tax=Elliptochloris bilobata TaxID=381761 RepID=A0AAW1S4T0_9CHLO
MCAAAVSTVLGAVIPAQRAEQAWTEGVAIWVAVVVVSFVASGNDYQKDQQFRKLNKEKDSIEVKAVRGGLECLVTNTDVVVGDILLLDTGDKLVADGIAVEAFGLASLTGESEPIRKSSSDPWCRSGTQVTEGSGRLLVLAVGGRSEWGRTMAMVASESAETPLQEALGLLAAAIGKVGLIVGGICFVVLLIWWCVQNRGFPVAQIASGPLAFFIFAVTIVVVAVPEGLPLAVTISLAMKKMMKDNNFVRVLAACETMGGATTICSDKTGTLTENRMAVVSGWFAGQFCKRLPDLAALPKHLQHVLSVNIALNSKAFLITRDKATTEFVGNRTECALLMLLRGWGISYEGAAEIVLDRCTGFLNSAGERAAMDEATRSELEGVIMGMATQGLRTLCLAVRELPREGGLPDGYLEAPPDEDLTICAIVGIKDPVRKEVPDTMPTCQRAGIRDPVRKEVLDAVATCQRAGIMVLARSSPHDKFQLVQLLKKSGDIVAVTGDGTNDAPALKESDVGLAMGIAGTEVAKEAADIVIMDDNFSSIVKSVLWGRSVFSNIRKFLQFQLTVNFVALVIAFVAAVTNGETPLNVLELLWVNLIMDAMAALALATEMPTPELLLEKPHGRNEPLISRRMWKHVVVQGLYQLFWLFLIIYGAPAQLPAFAALVQMDAATKWGQSKSNSLVFNEFNARKIQDELNVFAGVWQSRTFLYIEVITVAFQVIIMTTPIAHFFRCQHQDGFMWLFAVGVGAGSLLVSFLTKLLTRKGLAAAALELESDVLGVLCMVMLLTNATHGVDLSKDAAALKIAVEETSRYLQTHPGPHTERDVGRLSERVCARLAGEPVVRNVRVLQMQQKVGADEWAHIHSFQCEEGRQEERRQIQLEAERRAAVQAALDRQRAEAAVCAAAAAAEDQAAAAAASEDVVRWRKSEAAAHERQKAALARLRVDVDVQLQERRRARSLLTSINLEQDSRQARETLVACRKQMEAEEASHQRAKASLRAFLLKNEENKAVKAAAAQRAREEDLRLLALSEQVEAAREAERRELAGRVRAHQTGMLVPQPLKRWMSPSLIERNFQRSEEAREAEQQQRRDRAAAATLAFREGLAAQVRERRAARAAMEQSRSSEAAMVNATVEEDRARIRQEKERALQKKVALKALLEEQMRASSHRRIVQPMSDIEQKLNRRLLAKAHTCGK